MNAKEFLDQAALAERRLNAAKRKVALYKSLAEKVTSSLGGEQVSHTRDVTANEKAILRLVEAEECVKQREDEYHAVINEIVDVLSQLEEVEFEELLTNHYLKHQSLTLISENLHMCRSKTYNRHDEAMQQLEALLEK